LKFNFWVFETALESGYLTLSDIVGWADRRVLNLDSCPSWLFDLCLSKTKDQALETIWTLSHQARDQPVSKETGRPDEPSDRYRAEVYLGFLYLRYERGTLSMSELLRLAGEFSIQGGYIPSSIHSNLFYRMFFEEKYRPSNSCEAPLPKRVADVLGPMADLALESLELLPADLRESHNGR
jgi:hypothetical protein